MEQIVSDLKNKRKLQKSGLTRFKNYLNSVVENINQDVIDQLQLRLKKIEPLLDQFNEIQAELESLELGGEIDEDERENFESSFYATVGRAKSIVRDVQINSEGSEGSREASQVIQNVGTNQNVKLPSIKLPTFNGQYDSWIEFKNSFTALVGTNESLSDVQKFIYLKSSLEKEALEVIKGIEVTQENYSVVWQLLTERYQNKKLIVHNHIKAIFEYPSLSKESHLELRTLLDNIKKHLRALKGLGEVTESWDRLIIYIISSKFDITTKRDWESYKTKNELPTMEDLTNFLKTRCDLLERLNLTQLENNKVKPVNSKRIINSYASINKNTKCNYCDGPHSIYKCEPFLKLNVSEKVSAIKDKKLCFNCLRTNHTVKECHSRRCHECQGKHNTLIHRSNTNQRNEQEVSVGGHVTGKGQVLLATAMVHLGIGKSVVQVRALLDSGSQSNFITESLCSKLRLNKVKINHTIKGVGQALTNVSHQVKVNLSAMTGGYATELKCLVLPKITERLPTVSFSKNILNIPSNITLADPSFNEVGDIDLLLGSTVFWAVLKRDRITLGDNLPVMQDSQLGWILAGNLEVTSSISNYSISCLNREIEPENSTDLEVSKFWQLEEVSFEPVLTKEEQFCEDFFETTTKRQEDGRFVVKLPFKKPINDLGNSREIAARRFELLEHKLQKHPDLKLQYVAFMEEYLTLNHMVKVHNDASDGYFMPHHAVVKASSITTKCRVVFDASAKTSTNVSLNDLLAVGPKLQQDLFDILLRFRKHNIVLTADITKMYRQILVDPADTKFQRILWRSDPTKPLDCFELQTVTYGTASAPYSAVKCLSQVAKEIKDEYPLVSKIISNDFYMDDVLTGADSMEDALFLQSKLTEVLKRAGFELRKWLSNDNSLLSNVVIEPSVEAGVLNIAPDMHNKTLGIFWNACNDIIQYKLNGIEIRGPITKREVLSVICKIFDPLGLIGPVIVIAKLLMQELWKLKSNWDTVIPPKFEEEWLCFVEGLSIINEFKIPRRISNLSSVSVEIHGFCDASERAFGACVYLRCIDSAGNITTNLICSKSRVAPLKVVSLPRLELCGAVLLAKLILRVQQALDMLIKSKFLWTDSTITLAWIRAEPTRWKTFVANRVSRIQTLTDTSEWHHVRSEQNPADILSRGSSPEQLKKNEMWWNGPQFLSRPCFEIEEPNLLECETPELRIIAATNVSVVNEINPLLNKFSSIKKIVRIVAYILRFSKNIRVGKSYRTSGYLTPDELESALKLIIEVVQRESFYEDYKNLQKRGTVNSKSKILSLRPFLKDKLIRVGGRIRNAKEIYDKIHPIVLPKSHLLTELIIREEHERLLHIGPQALLASIREKYWPIAGRNTCKKLVKKCIKCFKVNPKELDYLMGDLPAVRVNEYLPFYNVGVDFAGPFLLRDRKGRGAKSHKAYLCLFVCMGTKAVHLEMVSELTSDAFIATLDRFVSRRGKPSIIYSDNALNFVGANNELARVYEFLQNNNEGIAEKLSSDRITWKFIPARSPSFGGIWEAGIKSSKYHLKRVMGNVSLTIEEFNTVLCKIEAILNSRPLCPLSNDPSDPTALTPAHLLIGRTLIALPEGDVTSVPEARLNRWQQLQAITQHFWARWHKEYLSELQTRTKWRQQAQQLLKEGTLVLLKEENVPPLNWQLGRIVALHPGSDQIVRVVSVKVRGSVTKRAINRLCALPIDIE